MVRHTWYTFEWRLWSDSAFRNVVDVEKFVSCKHHFQDPEVINVTKSVNKVTGKLNVSDTCTKHVIDCLLFCFRVDSHGMNRHTEVKRAYAVQHVTKFRELATIVFTVEQVEQCVSVSVLSRAFDIFRIAIS